MAEDDATVGAALPDGNSTGISVCSFGMDGLNLLSAYIFLRVRCRGIPRNGEVTPLRLAISELRGTKNCNDAGRYVHTSRVFTGLNPIIAAWTGIQTTLVEI